MRPLTRHVLLLGGGQTLGYASSYYLPALLAAPMAQDTGLPLAWAFAAFSLALIVSGVVGPAAGRAVSSLTVARNARKRSALPASPSSRAMSMLAAR